MRDLRDALRALRATPLVTVVAVLSLALGIGANSAMFSIVDALLLRPLPVQHADRLASLNLVRPMGSDNTSWTNPLWEEVRARVSLFDGATAWGTSRLNITEGGEAEYVDGVFASGSYFEVLGVPTVLGRPFGPGDDVRGGGPEGAVAVVSHRYWQERLGGAADVIGRGITLNGAAYTIIGVTPPSFFGAEVGRNFDVIVPLGSEPLIRGAESALDRRSTWWLRILVRLKPGQGTDAATAAIASVQGEIREATLPLDWRAGDLAHYLAERMAVRPASSGLSYLRARYDRPLTTLMAVVGLVLLIACGNVANLLLARANSRRHELSVRQALGASRWRLARQLLAESTLLSVVGAVGGVVLAYWGSRFLVRQLSTASTPLFLDLSVDWRVVAFTAAVAVATALLAGTAPAWRATRVAPMDAMKERVGSGTGAGAGAGVGGVAGSLVIAQVALSLVLVVAAGLFVRTFTSLSARDRGFDAEPILLVNVGTQRTGVEPGQRAALYQRLREAALVVPGVAGAAVSVVTPVSGSTWSNRVTVPGAALAAGNDGGAYLNFVTPGWLATMGTRLVDGRDLDERDRRGAPRVVVVNETFARKFFPGKRVVGEVVVTRIGADTTEAPHEIVGLAQDAVYRSLREEVPPTMYIPIAQSAEAPSSASLSVRAGSGAPMQLARAVGAAIAAVDPRLTVSYRALAEQVGASLVQERLVAQLSAFFGALALLLAGLGLYGVTAYSVSRRRAEMGIRLALGTPPAHILWLVLRRVGVQVGGGVVLGVATALWLARFVESLVYALPPRDLPTVLGAAAALTAVGMLAAWLPALRASRLDPAVVLREG